MPIKIVSTAGERDITLDEVKVAFNSKKDFPNLYSKNSSAYDRISQLEAQVAALQNTCKALWDAVEAGQAKNVAEPATVVGDKRQRNA